MKLSQRELDALVYALPKDKVFTSRNFLLTDRGVNIAGKYTGKPDDMGIVMMFGSLHVDLTAYQRQVISTVIFYNSTFDI